MDRKAALATAGAVAVTLAAWAFAFAVNLGIVGDRAHDGELQTVATAASESVASPPRATAPANEPQVITIFAEEPAPGAVASARAAAGVPTLAAPRSDDGDDHRSGHGSGGDDDDDDDDRSGRRSGDDDGRRDDDD